LTGALAVAIHDVEPRSNARSCNIRRWLLTLARGRDVVTYDELGG
jgi:hypothetical protein